MQCVCANSLNANAVPSSIYNLMDYPYCVSSPRLAVHLILCAREDAFATLWACVCSSWVAINQFTSKRCKLLPEGNMARDYIRHANSMVSRFLSLISFNIFIDHMVLYICFLYMFFVCLWQPSYIYMSIYIDRDLTGILIYRHPSSLGVFSS